MTDEKSTLEEVETRLSDLPDDKFLRVIELLQIVQSRPEVLRTMAQARPRLSRLRPPRPPTVQRVFYAPVEDLLTDLAEATVEGRIGRELMRRCWAVVKSGVSAATMAAWEERLKTSDGDRAKIREFAVEFWAVAGAALTTVLATVSKDKAAADKAFGPGAPMDLVSQIGGIYRMAEEIEGLKIKFPDYPVEDVEEEDVVTVQEAVARVRAAGKGDPSLLIWVLAARMVNPIGFMRRFLGGEAGVGSSAGGQRMVEASLAHLEGAARRTGDEPAEPVPMVRVAAEAEQLAAELAAAREMAGANWANDPRLQNIAGKLRETMQTKVLANAEDDILAIVPKVGGKTDKNPSAAITALPSREDLMRAEDRVRALRKAVRFGATLGLGDEPAQKLAAIKREIEQHLNSMLDQLGKQPASQEARPAAEQHVFNSARMIELADGPSAAYETLKRGQKRLESAMPKAEALS